MSTGVMQGLESAIQALEDVDGVLALVEEQALGPTLDGDP